jgi:Amt family ammonium transporter
MSAQTIDKFSALVAVNSLMATLGRTLVYGAIRLTVGLRLDQEDEYNDADLSIHKIWATPARESVG